MYSTFSYLTHPLNISHVLFRNNSILSDRSSRVGRGGVIAASLKYFSLWLNGVWGYIVWPISPIIHIITMVVFTCLTTLQLLKLTTQNQRLSELQN